MKSWLCQSLDGEDGLAFVEQESPLCGPDQVLIRNHNVALNFPDALITRGLYQIKPDPPFVPGSEMAGEVIAIGDQVRDVDVGQRVLALTGFGAFSEEVLVSPPMQQVLPIPDGMPYAEAAAFNMVFGTGLVALKQRGNLQPGETLLVLGASGGCGSAAVQIGKAMGARVIAAASSDEKCAIAKAQGADEVINYRDQDLRDQVKAMTAGHGADVVFDPVAADLFRPAVRSVAWNGRYLVIGFAGGDIPALEINYTLIKSISLIGVAYGMSAIKDPAMNADNFKQLFDWYQQGLIKPSIGKRYPKSDIQAALAELYAGQAVGKTVIDFN